MVDFIWQVLLALLGQEAEACTTDDPADHLEVTAHAAIHIVQDHTLLGHVVFDDDDAIGAQASLAAAQKLSQVLICQVAWGEEKCVSTYVYTCVCVCTLSTGPSKLVSTINPVSCQRPEF